MDSEVKKALTPNEDVEKAEGSKGSKENEMESMKSEPTQPDDDDIKGSMGDQENENERQEKTTKIVQETIESQPALKSQNRNESISNPGSVEKNQKGRQKKTDSKSIKRTGKGIQEGKKNRKKTGKKTKNKSENSKKGQKLKSETNSESPAQVAKYPIIATPSKNDLEKSIPSKPTPETRSQDVKMPEKYNIRMSRTEKRIYWTKIGGIIAIIIAILLLYICIVAVIDFTGGYKLRKLPPVLCNTTKCHRASAHLKKCSKFEIDPCTDFYEHVCGNYKEWEKRSNWKGDTYTTDPLRSKMKSVALDRLRKIDKACRKQNGSLISGIMKSDIAKTGWPLAGGSTNVDLTNKLIQFLKVRPDIGIIRFDWGMDRNIKTNRAKHVVILSRSSLFNEEVKEEDIRKDFEEIAAAVSNYKFPNRAKSLDSVTHRFMSVYRALKKVESIPFKNDKLREQIEWKRLVKAISPPSADFSHVLDIYRLLLYQIETVLKKHRKEDILNFVFFAWFRVNMFFSLKKNSCEEMLRALFPRALGFFYLYSKVDMKANDEVIEMTKNIRDSSIGMVNDSSWIDPKTKENLNWQLGYINWQVGYNELYEDKEELEKFYQTLKYQNENSFFEMVQDVQKWETQMMYEEIAGLRKEDFATRMMGLSFYSFMPNKIFLGSTNLNHPWFDREYPIYMNYGGVGFILGHEIGHSFGSTNYLLSRSGYGGRSKWDPVSAKNMENNLECLASYITKRFNANGTYLLEESSADLIGYRSSFRAMQAVANNMNQDVLLPGFEKSSNEQMYFYSMAADWCYDQSLLDVNDTHPNRIISMNGFLSLNKEFALAFGCKEGSPMNPINKCQYYGD